MDPFASHLPILVQAIIKTDGKILEIGRGFYSSPILELTAKNRLVSVEVDVRFHKENVSILLPNWSKETLFPFTKDHYSVVFIDPGIFEFRGEILKMFANCADFIICHDSDEPRYNYDFSQFKHEYHYTKIGKPWTTVVSNFFTLEIFKGQ